MVGALDAGRKHGCIWALYLPLCSRYCYRARNFIPRTTQILFGAFGICVAAGAVERERDSDLEMRPCKSARGCRIVVVCSRPRKQHDCLTFSFVVCVSVSSAILIGVIVKRELCVVLVNVTIAPDRFNLTNGFD